MSLSYSIDAGFAARAAGLIVLQTDETIEPEVGSVMACAGVTLFHSRIPSAPDVTPETLAKMAADLPQAATLLPTPAKLKAIGYGCTSGATVIGSAKVASLVQQAQPQALVTEPLTAICAAFDALGATRIGFLSPYAEQVSERLRDALTKHGYQITAFATFNEEREEQVARIDAASVTCGLQQVAQDAQGKPVDVLFASCTNLRTFSLIDEVEGALGIPIVSSNLALAWHLLKLLDLPTSGKGPGRLFG